MDINNGIELEDCPYCGGPGILEEEKGACWYVVCADCGSQTAPSEYHSKAERAEAAAGAAMLWNVGKVVRSDLGE